VVNIPIIERIEEIRHHLKISQKALCDKIGYSQGAYTSAKERKGEIGSNTLEEIKLSFPEINLDWLITGKGSMLLDAVPPETSKELLDCYKIAQAKDLKIMQLELELELAKKNIAASGVDMHR
jgi:predicted transcriptional regulator